LLERRHIVNPPAKQIFKLDARFREGVQKTFYFAHLLGITGGTPVPQTLEILKVALELFGALL
jgi:hypothetical protein